MTWSYSGDPSSNDKDKVRFNIGDTDETEQLLSDEEIEYALSQYSDIWGASAHCAEAIASQFAKRADMEAFSDVDIDLSQKKEHYSEMAENFRQRALGQHAPFAGGISQSQKESEETDTDRTEPKFEKDQFNNEHESL